MAGDRVGSRPVAIVNDAFVRRYLRGEPPIGQSVHLPWDAGAGTRYEIVGVVADAVHSTPREGMPATMCVDIAQTTPSAFQPTSS